MKNWILIAAVTIASAAVIITAMIGDQTQGVPRGRQPVVFWHFWGGADRDVVDDVVRRFNESQQEYFVRAIPMPGNNLQAKLFLSIAGSDPPDLVNQDDPIVGDWAARGAIQALDEIVSAQQVEEISNWLYPSARRLGTYHDRLFAVCNGLDIRAMYYNQTLLERNNLDVPASIEDLDRIATTLSPPDFSGPREMFGYLPDSRRLWAWGYVFGGEFYDANTDRFQIDQIPIERALDWMMQYSRWYGPDTINAFRQGDQSLPGKTFPLLPVSDDQLAGRYAVIMDGQWRTRDIRAFLDRRAKLGLPAPEFGVCPLPAPADGRQRAGWVNGNLFIVPKAARNPRGAVEFMKFWIGMGNSAEAAKTCADGGWIPVSEQVVNEPQFQEFLKREPLFAEFVDLASSDHQFPIPVIPGGPFLKRTVEQVAEAGMSDPDRSAAELLSQANRRVQARLGQESRQLP